MMNVEEILCDVINLNNTYIGEGPIDIDNCQWIRSTSGPSEDHFDKNTYDKFNFRVYVRGTSNEESRQRMDSIYRKLKSYIGANYVIVVNRLPHYMGSDVKYRHLYALNIEFQLGGY